MKKKLLFGIVFIAAMYVSSSADGYGNKKSVCCEMSESIVEHPCTLLVTGNLHSKKSGCTRGLGWCIKIEWVVNFQALLDLITQAGEGTESQMQQKVRGFITINPRNPNEVTIDFLNLDEEQMSEKFLPVEEDFLIDDPGLIKEPGNYQSITLLKGNYKIDRSENKVGRCLVRCRVN